MRRAALGKSWADGEAIVRQGEVGNSMYVVQAGEVEVLRETEDGEVRLAVLEAGDFFGEMSIFEREVRSATVRARGEARVLTVDKRMRWSDSFPVVISVCSDMLTSTKIS